MVVRVLQCQGRRVTLLLFPHLHKLQTHTLIVIALVMEGLSKNLEISTLSEVHQDQKVNDQYFLSYGVSIFNSMLLLRKWRKST
jgi:hypothetical protein